ncbi:ferredoxin [Amycolatopsis viridis]|uniref:Ferredoxin n=1 Tax=Amycolatopsis viridis TaxID=185678 RepID=A0ABX0SUZ3_9PSEU|nr:ferredoxin [Amycolatopsis viridis]NIH80794.1 hypothetical protein [Amycolatopsis viridis]
MSEPRTDARLDEVPMQPLRCHHCAARLMVRKSSVEQTSLQWNAEARAACPELRSAPAAGPAIAGCSRLRASVEAEVAAGRLRIVGAPAV